MLIVLMARTSSSFTDWNISANGISWSLAYFPVLRLFFSWVDSKVLICLSVRFAEF